MTRADHRQALSDTLRAWQARGEYRQLKGHRLFTLQAGQPDQPALLLIHGFPTASWDFHQIIDPLAERFCVISADLLGFGLSDKPTGHSYSLLEQADLMESLLFDHGVERYQVVAHDYGVSVAQELLARQREGLARTSQIERVCFMNGGLIPGQHHPRLIQRLLASPIGGLISALLSERSFRKSFSAVFAPQHQPSDAELAVFWELICQQRGQRQAHRLIRYMGERMQYKQRWVRELTEPLVPLRFICGELDPVSGRHMADCYQELSPNADVVRLPDIGHYPQCEAPQAVLTALFAFLHQHN